MTADLLRAALGLLAIFLGGAGLAAALGQPIAFAFPAGLVLLEVLARFAPPWVVLALLAAAALLALQRRHAAPPRLDPAALIFLAAWAALLLTVALHDPWIDSDAANHHRWMGLARLIREQGVPRGPRGDPVGPALAAAFVASLLSRWRDQAASLLWFSAWLAIVGLGFCLSARARGLAALLVCAFATLPLLTAHLVRPGFAETLLVLFLLAGLALLERSPGPLGARAWALLGLFALGLAMTKLEGLAWAAWLLLAALTRDLEARQRARWPALLGLWAAAGAALVSLHLLLGERLEPAAGTADDRLRWIYEHHWAPRALLRFAADALSASSFSLLWWWTAGAAAWLLSRSKQDRPWVFLCAAPLAAVAYFCCFTGNVAHTLIGTDVSRFLLQASPLALSLLLRWARRLEAA